MPAILNCYRKIFWLVAYHERGVSRDMCVSEFSIRAAYQSSHTHALRVIT